MGSLALRLASLASIPTAATKTTASSTVRRLIFFSLFRLRVLCVPNSAPSVLNLFPSPPSLPQPRMHLRLFRQILHRQPRLMHHQEASRSQSHHRHRPL